MNIGEIRFTIVELSWLLVLLVTFGFQLYYYLRYFAGILRHRRRIRKDKVEFLNRQPGVSVVICARDEEENLRKFLPLILEQDYPEYEVIVVNDASMDYTDDYLSLMTKQHPNLHTTFVPAGATNMSTKKLGLTLGIKAARYDLLLFTDADCMPEGRNWIASMARNFTPTTEFVLGYGGYLKKKGLLNTLIKYDTLFIALQYMGMAIARRPYMGVGRNLAYRSATFFRMKGFASTLHLQSGDDDLMINRGATSENTAVEISPESVTWSEPKTTFRQWFIQKERHLSVSDQYNAASKLRLTTEPVSRAVFYLSLVFVGLFGNWISMAATGFIFLIRYLMQAIIINKSAKQLGEQRFFLSILLLDIFLPLITLNIMVFGRKRKKKGIKWK